MNKREPAAYPVVPILFEDNHVLGVTAGQHPSQEDATGDPDMLTILKQDIKERYNKPGNVFWDWCTVWTVRLGSDGVCKDFQSRIPIIGSRPQSQLSQAICGGRSWDSFENFRPARKSAV